MEEKTNRTRKNFIRVSVFLLFFLTLLFSTIIITMQFSDRQNGSFRQFRCFYAQPEGTVDVLFAGSSRVHSNINPVGLWEGYGISSYCLGLNGQTVDTTYYALREAFRYQKPKVVIVEVSQLPDNDGHDDHLPSINGMRYGANYLMAFIEKCSFRNAMNGLLEFPLYHGRYEMVDKDIYVEDTYPEYPQSHAAGYKGAVEYYHSTAFEDYTDEYREQDDRLFDAGMDRNFDRIAKLCNDNGTGLIFTLTPAAYRIKYSGIDDYFSRHPELTFINLSDYYEEIGIDTSSDFIDEGHMNIYGSKKVGSFFAKILSENYDLKDHRGDAAYISWEENKEYHYEKIKDNGLNMITGFGTYFNCFPDENYIAVICLLDGYDSSFIGQEDALKHVLCNEDVYRMGGTWVIDGSNIIYGALGYESDSHPSAVLNDIRLGHDKETAGNDAHRIKNDWHSDIGDRVIEITDDENGVPCIYIDDVDYSVYKNSGKDKVTRGIEAVVYDKLSEQVIDAVCFDADNEWAATRGSRSDTE
ncbi:MAG: hypothetical protein J5829_02355 [Lachnospiraceae bacterium]|nr:hypothetical protein [Lachnospiraceae bacterium]